MISYQKKYSRMYGDDLFSKDSRLRYRWIWNRLASCVDEEIIKNWTHFQSSKAYVFDWTLKAIQWSNNNNDNGVDYEAEVRHGDHTVIRKKGFKTRLDAQIGAENLLINWLTSEYKKIIGKR